MDESFTKGTFCLDYPIWRDIQMTETWQRIFQPLSLKSTPETTWERGEFSQNSRAWLHDINRIAHLEEIPLSSINARLRNKISNISCELVCQRISGLWKSKDSCEFLFLCTCTVISISWYPTIYRVEELELTKTNKIQIGSLSFCIFLATARLIVCRETKDCAPGYTHLDNGLALKLW